MERILWAKCSVVMNNFPIERDGIARENLGYQTIHELMMFVNVRVAVHKHSGDHERPASDAKQITSGFQTEARMPALSCLLIKVGGAQKRTHSKLGAGFRQI